MPFQILRNDITNMQVDAIVNTANPRPVVGYGVDAGIHQKAGPELLLARKRIGNIRIGNAAITPGFALPAKFVIHTAGPVWQGGGQGEVRLLRGCYARSLKLAMQNDCKSIAFPLISAGNHGFPKDIALQAAMHTIQEFLMKHEMMVYLVVFSRDAFRMSGKLFQDIASFIDEHYILESNLKQYGVADKCTVRGMQQELVLQEQLRRRQAAAMEECCLPEAPPPIPCVAPTPKKAERKRFSLPFAKPSLSELLEATDAGFSETLLRLIDRTGKKDSEIYTKANVSRQHFSKIRNNPGYQPTKPTAIAFAIALELDLEQTRDLIGRAGFALTNSSKFDVIIMYFIRQKNYNMMDINAALFEFDQSLIGS